MRPPSAHHLFPRSIGTSPAPRSTRAPFLSFTRAVSAILSLYVFILGFTVNVLSMVFLIRSRHSSFCGFVAFPCDASAAEPGQLPVFREFQCPKTRRRTFWVQHLALFQAQSLALGVAPSLSAVTFFVNFISGAECHTFPVRRFPSITQCLSCPTFASHNSILGNAQNCSCSIMMTHKDSSSDATRRRADTVFSNFTNPNFLSKLRHWLSPSSTSSPHFTRFAVFADPHFVHDLRCKTRKPTE